MQKLLKILLFLPLILTFFSESIVLAYSTTEIVDISLRLSLCGDGLVEGEEDCEQNVGITKSCLDYGYQEGLLTCDYSCSFDYSNCKYINKPSKPTEEKPAVDTRKTEFNTFFSDLPLFLRIFDLNRDGQIDLVEFTNILFKWVDNWQLFRQTEQQNQEDVKGACDVNGDSLCNVIDFSIILYYVDND